MRNLQQMTPGLWLLLKLRYMYLLQRSGRKDWTFCLDYVLPGCTLMLWSPIDHSYYFYKVSYEGEHTWFWYLGERLCFPS